MSPARSAKAVGKRKKVIKLRLHVREIAETHNMTKTRLSRVADVNYNTIKALWEDEAHDVMLVTLVKVSRALHVSVDTLYTIIDTDD